MSKALSSYSTPGRHYSVKDNRRRRNRDRPPSAISRSRSSARIGVLRDARASEEISLGLGHPPFSVLRYGMGLGPGVGATLQMADAHGGSGGLGISDSLPWVAAEP